MNTIYRILRMALPAVIMFTATGCFKDLGNYSYVDINEVVIGDKGFDTPYNIRITETLTITPDITFTLDPEGTGNYSYEWVAVGQNLYRGQRFVIGTDRNLDYVMNLDAENYILYLKVTEINTGIVYSKDVELNVQAAYSVGWLLAGEADGSGQMDMMSISDDIIFYKNVLEMEDGTPLGPVECVWVNNDIGTSEDRVYVGTSLGSYKLERETLTGSAESDIRYSFAIDPGEDTYYMTDSQAISTENSGTIRHVIVVNNRSYTVSTEGGLIENSFSFYEDANGLQRDIHVADRFICNQKQNGNRTMAFYNTDDREFCYISGLTVEGMKTLGDGESDTFSWKTKNDFGPDGLEYVSIINSFFSDGQSAAILKVPGQDTYYIYCITANRNMPDLIKNGRFQVDNSVAPGFAQSPGYAMTSNHGYMLYASGNTLYGYNFRSTPQKVEVLRTFDAPVCFIMSDNETAEKYDDMIYVATYDDSRSRSGILYKFQMVDSPDRMEVTESEKWDEGLLKIHDMFYKTF